MDARMVKMIKQCNVWWKIQIQFLNTFNLFDMISNSYIFVVKKLRAINTSRILNCVVLVRMQFNQEVATKSNINQAVGLHIFVSKTS